MITKFKDLILNIECIKNVYKGSQEELDEEEICFADTFVSHPHAYVGVYGCEVPLAIAKELKA